jgi:methyl-accepting chemotaxis protein
MKINLPITNREVELEEGRPIVSKTDLKGVITYVNSNFVKISGFSEQELLGKSHNLVRHPDMPSAAFEDLWDTVRAGHPWSGVVKNRCKNGDYYWVDAHVVPIREGGHAVGYMSVRSKPTREQIERASILYRQMNDGKTSATSWTKGLTMWKKLSLQSLLYGVLGLVLATAGILAFRLMRDTDVSDLAGGGGDICHRRRVPGFGHRRRNAELPHPSHRQAAGKSPSLLGTHGAG